MRFLRLLAFLTAFTIAHSVAAQPAATKETTELPAGATLRLGSTRYRMEVNSTHQTLTQDGKHIIVMRPNELAFLSVENGRLTKTVKLKENVQYGYGISLNPAGDRLLIAGYNTATVVDPANGDILAKLLSRGNDIEFGRRISQLNDGQVSMSADGKRLAFGSRYARDAKEGVLAYVYDTEKGNFISEVKVEQSQYINTTLSPDGKKLVTFGQHQQQEKEESRSGNASIWDIETKKEIAKLKTSTSQVLAAIFSTDGKTVYTSGQTGPLEAWDVATGKRIRQFITRSNTGQRLFISADGKRLAATSTDGAVQVWDTVTGKREAVGFAPTNQIDAVALPPGEPAVAFGRYYQTMQVWKVPGELLTPQEGHFGPVSFIQYSADGKHILTAGQDGRIIRWDATTGQELEVYGHATTTRAFGNRANFAGSRLSNRANWSNSWNLYSGVFAPDTKQLYVMGPNGGIAAVELATGNELHTLFFPNARGGSAYSRPSISGDGRRVGGTGQYYDRNKYIYTAAAWDTETGESLVNLRKEIDNQKQYLNGMATVLSPDGTYFGVSINLQDQQTGQAITELSTFDLRTGQKLAASVLTGRMLANFLTASPDNRSAIGFDQNNRLVVWDLPTGKQTRTMTNTVSNINQPVFHPHGRLFALPALASTNPATGLNRLNVRLIEWASGEVRKDLTSIPGGSITAVQFSPDGRSLAVGYQDSTVLIFDLNAKTGAKPTTESTPEKLWSKLTGQTGSDVDAAMRELIERPDLAMTLIQDHIKPSTAPTRVDDDKLKTLFEDLDAPAFTRRDTAMKELKTMGKLIEKDLRALLETTPSPEVKERIERLLENVVKPVSPNVTESRAVELLELLGTPAAKEFLAKLAKGDPASLMTQDAAASVKRLGNK